MTAAEQVAALARVADPETAAAVEDLRHRTGAIGWGFRFEGETAELRAQAAWSAVRVAAQAKDKGAKSGSGVSCWRCVMTRVPWVVLMGEESGRPFIRRAGRIVRSYGGVKAEPEARLLQALRARRWNTVCEGLLTQTQGASTLGLHVAHYGRGGAQLNPDGTMSPVRRPQG